MTALNVLVRSSSFPAVKQQKPRIRIYVLAALLMLPFAAGAIWSSDQIHSLLYIFLTLSFGLFFGPSLVRVIQFTGGKVHVDLSRSLNFSANIGINGAFFVSSLCLSAGSACILLTWILPNDSPFGKGSRGGIFVVPFFLLISAVFLVWTITRFFRRVGVRIDETGVTRRSAFTSSHLRWDEIDRVTVTPARGAPPVMRLHSTFGIRRVTSQRAYSIDYDSDTLVVAEAIEYFRTHPEERAKTRDPLVALRSFADITR